METEIQTALGIAQSMAQSIEALESYWAPSKRGSNALAFVAAKPKRKKVR